MPINICSTLMPRFDNRALFWTIWKSAWKPLRSYMEIPFISKCCTSPEQLLLWMIFVRQVRQSPVVCRGCKANYSDPRSSGISPPLLQDKALFKEVDLVMAEIRRFYEDLNKFWREEICHVVEALKKRRVGPRDFERWNSFRSSLNQTIEFWKVCSLPLLLCNVRIPNWSNIMFRTSHQAGQQAATLKPYLAMTHPLLQSVYSAFYFDVPLD